jgi:hypothetical protein
MSSNLYFDPTKRSAFSPVRKLVAASPRETKPNAIKAWFLKQDVYMLHRPVRKHFIRNPYDVTNVMTSGNAILWTIKFSVNLMRNTNIYYQ